MLSFKGSKKQQEEDGGDALPDVEYPPPKAASAYGKLQDEAPSLLHVFSLDLRSLALFRVLIALVVIIDVASRSRSLYAHYATLGVWPVVEAFNALNAHSFSFLFASGNMPFLVIFFISTAIAAFFMLIGFKTRLSTIITWLMVLSIQNRNVLLLNSGDDFLRMLLFWSIFLPLGERFSVDDALKGGNIALQSNRYLSLASFAFIAQITAICWVGYSLKTGVEWEEGTAMYYLFSIDQYTTPFGYIILRMPFFLRILTHTYLWFELLMPIMLVFPVAHGPVRTITCLVNIAIFLFLSLCLELGLFTYAPLIAAVGLFPAWFWDNLVVAVSGTLAPSASVKYWSMGGSLTFYYAPGPYSSATKLLLQLANSFLGLNSPILAAEKQTKANFDDSASYENVEDNNSSDIGAILSENNLLWLAVDVSGRRHTGYKGFITILGEVPFLAPVVPVVQKMESLVALTYRFYSFIFMLPGVRYFLACQMASNTVPSPVPTRTTSRRGPQRVTISDLVALGFLLYILWWNVGTVSPEYQVPQSLQFFGMLFRIDQWWSMFAPYPMKDDGWFVIAAKLANGKEVDLFKPGGAPLATSAYDKPTFVSRTFPDHRWRRYLMNLWSTQHQEKRLFYGRYLCRQWNWYGKGSTDRDYMLKTFKIVYLREITLQNYKVKGPEPMVLWEHQC